MKVPGLVYQDKPRSKGRWNPNAPLALGHAQARAGEAFAASSQAMFEISKQVNTRYNNLQTNELKSNVENWESTHAKEDAGKMYYDKDYLALHASDQEHYDPNAERQPAYLFRTHINEKLRTEVYNTEVDKIYDPSYRELLRTKTDIMIADKRGGDTGVAVKEQVIVGRLDTEERAADMERQNKNEAALDLYASSGLYTKEEIAVEKQRIYNTAEKKHVYKIADDVPSTGDPVRDKAAILKAQTALRVYRSMDPKDPENPLWKATHFDELDVSWAINKLQGALDSAAAADKAARGAQDKQDKVIINKAIEDLKHNETNLTPEYRKYVMGLALQFSVTNPELLSDYMQAISYNDAIVKMAKMTDSGRASYIGLRRQSDATFNATMDKAITATTEQIKDLTVAGGKAEDILSLTDKLDSLKEARKKGKAPATDDPWFGNTTADLVIAQKALKVEYDANPWAYTQKYGIATPNILEFHEDGPNKGQVTDESLAERKRLQGIGQEHRGAKMPLFTDVEVEQFKSFQNLDDVDGMLGFISMINNSDPSRFEYEIGRMADAEYIQPFLAAAHAMGRNNPNTARKIIEGFEIRGDDTYDFILKDENMDSVENKIKGYMEDMLTGDMKTNNALVQGVIAGYYFDMSRPGKGKDGKLDKGVLASNIRAVVGEKANINGTVIPTPPDASASEVEHFFKNIPLSYFMTQADGRGFHGVDTAKVVAGIHTGYGEGKRYKIDVMRGEYRIWDTFSERFISYKNTNGSQGDPVVFQYDPQILEHNMPPKDLMRDPSDKSGDTKTAGQLYRASQQPNEADAIAAKNARKKARIEKQKKRDVGTKPGSLWDKWFKEKAPEIE